MADSPVLPPPPTDEQAARHLNEARNLAAANLVLITQKMGLKATDVEATPRTILEAAEFNYKLSGMAAKQAQGNPAASGFQIAFNFNAAKPSRPIVDVTPEPGALPELPAHLSILPVTNDLVVDAEIL